MQKHTKASTLQQWSQMEANAPILRHMRAIPYKSKGSTFGACGIRIDGTPEFVDAVLSHLKELLAGEAVETRLQLSRQPAVSGFKAAPNAAERAEVCYIRLHERGHEGKIMAAFSGYADTQTAQMFEARA